MSTAQPVLATLDEVAVMLRLSKTFIRDQVKAGAVTPLRVGNPSRGPMRFRPEDVDDLLRLMTPPEPKPEPVVTAGRRRPHRRT